MKNLHPVDPESLRRIAFAIRRDIIRTLAVAGSGHLGGSLGLADIFTTLFFSVLQHDPKNPDWADRDRFILSIGHVAPVFYTTLAHAGYFSTEELVSLRKLGSRLQGHPGRDHGLPGIELSAGSLGQGLSVAAGMALAAKIDRKSHHIFCLTGDGELQEGSIWETAMAASHHQLDNLTALVDRNGLQIDGSTEKVMGLEPLAEKWTSFGWNVIRCNGHDFHEMLNVFRHPVPCKGKPTVIILKTIMGKGVTQIENDYRWHGRAPSAEQAEIFLKELECNYLSKSVNLNNNPGHDA